MINYDWNCKTVDVYTSKNDNTNVVYNVHWIVTGEDSETNISQTSIGTQSLNIEEIEEFIEFENLTHETIIGWVKGSLGEEKVQAIEEGIAKTIEEVANPTTLTLTVESSETD